MTEEKPETIIWLNRPSDLAEIRIRLGDENMTLCVLTLIDGSQMWMDEDGIPKQLPINSRASKMAMTQIYGSVIILRGSARLTD